jgi:hypothetical protein
MSPTRKRVSEPNAVERVSRIVEMKLPLPWLISTATVAFGSLFTLSCSKSAKPKSGKRNCAAQSWNCVEAVAQKERGNPESASLQSAELRTQD